MDYMTVGEASTKWNITKRRIQVLCKAGRISGVVSFGKSYAIPSNAQKPRDARIKSGKYIKTTSNNE